MERADPRGRMDFISNQQILLQAPRCDSQGSEKNQKSDYLKRNTERVLPAGGSETALGGMSVDPSSPLPAFLEQMEKKMGGKGKNKGLMFALLLIFASQSIFVCAGGEVSIGSSQNLCSWVCELVVLA